LQYERIIFDSLVTQIVTVIDRMKKLFSSSKGLTVFDTKETVIELNGVKIEAFPSHLLDAMRGLPNVSFILLDEADFFPPGQQADARDVSDRYIAKSNPYIVMVSTPNAPEGLFERIEKEAEDTCLYKRIFLDYTYGIGKIYTAEEIEKAKQSPSFEREYNLKIGNVFHTKDIEAAIEKGRKYNPDDFTPFYSFTSDPHPGNISITDNGAIILYDYGMVGRLDIKTRLRLIRLYLGLVDKDASRTVNVLMELGTLEPTVNRYFVEKAVDMSIQSLYGKEVDKMEVRALTDLANKTLSRFPFRLPKNLALYMRMASLLEGIYFHHKVRFQFIKMVANLLEEEGVIREAYIEEAKTSIQRFAKSIDSALNVAPMLQSFLETQQHYNSITQKDNTFIAGTILASGLFVGSSIILPYNTSLAYAGFASALLSIALVIVRRKF
jgi:hypothetical protein